MVKFNLSSSMFPYMGSKNLPVNGEKPARGSFMLNPKIVGKGLSERGVERAKLFRCRQM